MSIETKKASAGIRKYLKDNSITGYKVRAMKRSWVHVSSPDKSGWKEGEVHMNAIANLTQGQNLFVLIYFR